MHLLARYHRFRLSRTTKWLPYEQQVHALLLDRSDLVPLRPVLQSQLSHLHLAHRSPSPSELAATYSYSMGMQLWSYTQPFTLCAINAGEANGSVFFDGGMLARIALDTAACVSNPARFLLTEPTIDMIALPRPDAGGAQPAPAWAQDLVSDDLIEMAPYEGPAEPSVQASDLHPQYLELFRACGSCSVNLVDGQVGFLRPVDLSVITDDAIGRYIPVLGLDDSTGLVILQESGNLSFAYVDAEIQWRESELPTALRRLAHETRT